MTNAKNLRKCVLWTVVTTAVLILNMGSAHSGDVQLTSEGKVPGGPFTALQLQIDDNATAITNNATAITDIQLIPGPQG